MAEGIQIILGILFLLVVFVLTRFGVAWRMKRAVSFVVADLERRGALDAARAVELPYAGKTVFNIGIRDFRPKSVEYLVHAEIVGITGEGKYYLKSGTRSKLET